MIKIQIEKETRKVNIDKSLIGNDNENLQDNLEFSFLDEFVDGQARLELQFEKTNEKTFITLNKVNETYTIPVTNVMTIQGKIYAQLVITEGTNEEDIPIFKSNIFYFYVNQSINAETGDREPYIEWIDRANVKLNQIDNLIPDLTDYVKNTDYATDSVGGVVKSSNYYGTYVGSGGTLVAGTKTYANYQSGENAMFISKGTLENVITGKELVNKTYVDDLVGDINSALDSINGEVI